VTDVDHDQLFRRIAGHRDREDVWLRLGAVDGPRDPVGKKIQRKGQPHILQYAYLDLPHARDDMNFVSNPDSKKGGGLLYLCQVDVFSFAMCLVEMVSCELPWKEYGEPSIPITHASLVRACHIWIKALT
jgi:hypothetical protein